MAIKPTSQVTKFKRDVWLPGTGAELGRLLAICPPMFWCLEWDTFSAGVWKVSRQWKSSVESFSSAIRVQHVTDENKLRETEETIVWSELPLNTLTRPWGDFMYKTRHENNFWLCCAIYQKLSTGLQCGTSEEVSPTTKTVTAQMRQLVGELVQAALRICVSFEQVYFTLMLNCLYAASHRLV